MSDWSSIELESPSRCSVCIVSFGLFSIEAPSTLRLGIGLSKTALDVTIDGRIANMKAMGTETKSEPAPERQRFCRRNRESRNPQHRTCRSGRSSSHWMMLCVQRASLDARGSVSLSAETWHRQAGEAPNLGGYDGPADGRHRRRLVARDELTSGHPPPAVSVAVRRVDRRLRHPRGQRRGPSCRRPPPPPPPLPSHVTMLLVHNVDSVDDTATYDSTRFYAARRRVSVDEAIAAGCLGSAA